jgi:membrane-associated protease RseP (regulator of RpoE activity)
VGIGQRIERIGTDEGVFLEPVLRVFSISLRIHSQESRIKRMHPATISGVEAKSTAARAGVHTGDRLLTLNGAPLRDVIDVQVCAAEPELVFEIERRAAIDSAQPPPVRRAAGIVV